MSEGDDPFHTIPCAAIGAVSEVRVYSSTLAKVATGHPEVVGHLDNLPQTFSNPSAIYAGNVLGSTFVFENAETTHEGHPMVATVKVINGTSARMSTCYFTSSYSTSKDPIWTPTDE